MHDRSHDLFKDAKEHLVGGVNSPVRAFNSVGSSPVFMNSGKGAMIHSEDGQSYVDYVLSFGPLLLGHADSRVTEAISKAAQLGTSFGAPTVKETALAKQVKRFYPYVDKVRFVNSGTEAVMSAIRLARGVSGKSIIVKFVGCYHGHSDALLVAAGSGSATLSQPDSQGVLSETVKHTALLPYNDTDAIKTFFAKHAADIAAVVIEPVAGNMGLILPEQGFIDTISSLCLSHQALLIFDEVMCGFRSQLGGTHTWLSVEPDIVVLGKVIGAGLPCAAYAARQEIMSFVAPEGPVYQAGTLSGNPLAMSAGLACLEALEKADEFDLAVSYTSTLVTELNAIAKHYKLPLSISHKGTMFTLFFRDGLPKNFTDVQQCDFELFSKFFRLMLAEGIYLPPSQYEACFSSTKHAETELTQTLQAFEKSLSGLV